MSQAVLYRKDVFAVALSTAYFVLSKELQPVRHKEGKAYTIVYDSILHALAFAVAMEFPGYFGRMEGKRYVGGIEIMTRKLTKWANQHKDEVATKRKHEHAKNPVPVYTLIMKDIKADFKKEKHGWVWDNAKDIPNTATTAEWEYGRVRLGLVPRWEYYPVQSAIMKENEQSRNREIAQQESPSNDGGSDGTPLQPPVDDAHGLLAKLAELLGEKRFDTWFAEVTYETSADSVVFTVQNDFVRNSIKRHCAADVESALQLCGLPTEYRFALRGEEVKETMESTDKVSVEHYIKNVDEYLKPEVQENGELRIQDFAPSGLKGDDLKAFRQAAKQRMQEMEQEYLQSRNRQVAH